MKDKYINLMDLADYLLMDYRTIRNYFRNYQLTKFYNENTRMILFSKTCAKLFEQYLYNKRRFQVCEIAYHRFLKFKEKYISLQ